MRIETSGTRGTPSGRGSVRRDDGPAAVFGSEGGHLNTGRRAVCSRSRERPADSGRRACARLPELLATGLPLRRVARARAACPRRRGLARRRRPHSGRRLARADRHRARRRAVPGARRVTRQRRLAERRDRMAACARARNAGRDRAVARERAAGAAGRARDGGLPRPLPAGGRRARCAARIARNRAARARARRRVPPWIALLAVELGLVSLAPFVLADYERVVVARLRDRHRRLLLGVCPSGSSSWRSCGGGCRCCGLR